MLNITYLRQILAASNNGLDAVTDPAEQVIDSPDIMEGLNELCMHKGLPFAILFEEAYHYTDNDSYDVPQQTLSQSLYVMRMVNADNGARADEAACFDDVRHIRALLLDRQAKGDAEVIGWDRRPKRDFVSGGANYVGWKITLTFTDDDDWTLSPWAPVVPQQTEQPSEQE